MRSHKHTHTHTTLIYIRSDQTCSNKYMEKKINKEKRRKISCIWIWRLLVFLRASEISCFSDTPPPPPNLSLIFSYFVNRNVIVVSGQSYCRIDGIDQLLPSIELKVLQLPMVRLSTYRPSNRVNCHRNWKANPTLKIAWVEVGYVGPKEA